VRLSFAEADGRVVVTVWDRFGGSVLLSASLPAGATIYSITHDSISWTEPWVKATRPAAEAVAKSD